jgi:hypothetical protein
MSNPPRLRQEVRLMEETSQLPLHPIPVYQPTDPKMPSFARFLAERCSSKYRALNNIVLVSGPRGVGKSWLCLSLAWGISRELSRIHHPKKPEAFFSIPDNITSIDETGILRLLSSPKIKELNQVYIMDDAGVGLGNRKFNQKSNIAANEVLQVCRVYRSTLIINMIRTEHVDLLPRQISDFQIEVLGANVLTGQSVCKISLVRKNYKQGAADLHPFLRWKKKRVRYWLGCAPPPHLAEAYEKLRLEQTSAHIDRVREKNAETLGEKEKGKGKRARDIAAELAPRIRDLSADGMSLRAISRKLKVSQYIVETALAEY